MLFFVIVLGNEELHPQNSDHDQQKRGQGNNGNPFDLLRFSGGPHDCRDSFLHDFFRPFFDHFLEHRRHFRIHIRQIENIDLVQQIQHGLRAVCRIFLHHFFNQSCQFRRDFRIQLQNRHGIRADHFYHDVKSICPGERRLPRQHLIKGCAETVNIRAGVHGTGIPALFRRRIRGCPHHRPFHRQRIESFTGCVAAFCDPKIRQLHMTIRCDHNIGGLDVTVNDPTFCSIRKSLCGLTDDKYRLSLRQRTVFQKLADGVPLHIFHHDIGETGR